MKYKKYIFLLLITAIMGLIGYKMINYSNSNKESYTTPLNDSQGRFDIHFKMKYNIVLSDDQYFTNKLSYEHYEGITIRDVIQENHKDDIFEYFSYDFDALASLTSVVELLPKGETKVIKTNRYLLEQDYFVQYNIDPFDSSRAVEVLTDPQYKTMDDVDKKLKIIFKNNKNWKLFYNEAFHWLIQ